MARQELINARGDRTQTVVAEALGISQKYLSKIELGQRTPSANLLAKFASYYKKPLDVLFPDIFLPFNTPKGRKTNADAEIASEIA
jgi:transcriptional regulator with XRE-family HTH domain